MIRNIFYYSLLLFILSDISYSFIQDMQMPLEGDMAEAILPANGYEKIFKDPFGITVITENSIHPNPNRFFVQWIYAKYFQHLPFILQNIVSPIESIYYCCAIAKIFIQTGILILMGFYITGKRTVLSLDFLISIVLIVPLFQTNGYRGYMGIIDPSITYSFSYALPCALLMLFYLPFFNVTYHGKEIVKNKLTLTLLFLFTIVLSFNGPLLPGVILVISLLYFLYQIKLNNSKTSSIPLFTKTLNSLKKIPKFHFYYFSFISILCLYSLYIGGNNSQFINEKITILERYKRLPEGIYYTLTQKAGYPLLLIMIGINTYLIHKNCKNETGNKILKLLEWIGLFSLLYILLLPLGGYRSYRPYIIRYDSIMPITLALFFIYSLSSVFLLQHLKNKGSKLYIVILVAISMIFMIADEPEFNKNQCEKTALKELAESKENIVLLENDCTVLAWKKISDPNKSALNAQLLYYWNITKEKKLYYQK